MKHTAENALTREVDLAQASRTLAAEWAQAHKARARKHTKDRRKIEPPDPRSAYAPYWIPGGGYDYRAMEEAGFDVS